LIDMKLKSKLVLMVTLPDILITWIITRTLDYVIRRLRGRIKFKGHIHFPRRLLRSIEFWMSYFYIVYYFSDKNFLEHAIKSQSFFREMVMMMARTVLSSHRRWHRDRRFGAKSCSSCQIITENKEFLQRLAPDLKLYPPFDFSEK
jgi:hypothetical protein